MTTGLLVTAVKQRLVDVWSEVLGGATVSYGPVLSNPPRELVVLHDVRPFGDSDSPSAETGPTSRKPSFHNFTIEGVLGCRQIGQTALASEQRAEQIYNTMKDATVDPGVAGPNLYGGGRYPTLNSDTGELLWVWLRPGDMQTDHADPGWQTTLSFFVDCRTRLK